MKKIESFLLCKNPAREKESGEYILHTRVPRCLVEVHKFNTYEERDNFVKSHNPVRLADNIEAAGALSVRMPVAYECIMIMDPVDSDYKIESLMRRIADWHYAIQTSNIVQNKRNSK